MSSVEFVQYSLRNHIAPIGSSQSVKGRIGLAARRLRWAYTRTKDAWYADPRISIKADELRQIEECGGVKFGRQEIREIDEIIGRAETLLDGPHEDFYRPFIAALRAMARAADRTGTER